MCPSTSETSARVRLDIIVRRYRELKDLIAEAQVEAARLHDEIAEHIEETGEVVEVEGLPPLRLHEESAGMVWDSWAIEKLQTERPAEWERIRELGAIKLDATTMRKAVQAGQLMGLPAGGIEPCSIRISERAALAFAGTRSRHCQIQRPLQHRLGLVAPGKNH